MKILQDHWIFHLKWKMKINGKKFLLFLFSAPKTKGANFRLLKPESLPKGGPKDEKKKYAKGFVPAKAIAKEEIIYCSCSWFYMLGVC